MIPITEDKPGAARMPGGRRNRRGNDRASARRLLIAVFAATLGAVAPHAAAQSFPSKPIRIVVGFTAGTTTDITARALGQKLTERLGQQVVIENREGANSGIANSIVARATPDGHTILMGTLSLVVSPLLYKELPFDPNDLVPVSLVVLAQNVIAVNPKLEANSIKDLIALAKAQPGRLSYGSSGRGSSAFLTVELFKSMAGIDLREIPYKSTSQAVTDLISGEIPIYPPSLVSAIPHIKSGRIRPLAVTGAKRSPIAPDIPSVAETVPGYDAATGVYGLMVSGEDAEGRRRAALSGNGGGGAESGFSRAHARARRRSRRQHACRVFGLPAGERAQVESAVAKIGIGPQ
jgi:tripartite-type tricarboxylate transporter receptor subunit TctC